jgi:hypothetical protein
LFKGKISRKPYPAASGEIGIAGPFRGDGSCQGRLNQSSKADQFFTVAVSVG